MNILPKNFVFSPLGEKIVKKFPPIFHFQEWKSVQICTFLEKIVKIYTFLGKNCQDIHFFEKNLTKIALFWVKIAKICTFWGKKYQNLQFFWVKVSPHSYSVHTPPLLLFGRIFTYGSVPLVCSMS